MIDQDLQKYIKEETNKLNDTICLIASEGLPNQDILDIKLLFHLEKKCTGCIKESRH